MALGNPMPAAVALGIEVVRDEPGRAVCRLVIAPSHLNQGLVAHGGVLFTLADTALGIAANPAGEPTWVGTQFSLQLVRAAGVGDVIVADAREEHRSRRLASYAVRLERDGALAGTMTAQLLAAPVANGPVGAITTEAEPPGSPLATALLASAAREDPDAPDRGERAARGAGGRAAVRLHRGRLRVDPPRRARPGRRRRATGARAGLTAGPSRRPALGRCGCRSRGRARR